jgi:ATP-binding cassette subfamily B protein
MSDASVFNRYGAMPLLRLRDIPESGNQRVAVDWGRTLPLLWRYLVADRLALAAVLVSLLIAAALILLAPYLLGVAIDTMLVNRVPASSLRLLGLLAAVYLAQLFVTAGQSRAMISIAQRTVWDIRRDVFAHLHRLPMTYYARRRAGEVASRLTNDLDNLGQSLAQAVLRIGTSIVVFLGMLGMMIWLNPILALVSLTVVPMMYYGLKWMGARTPTLFKRQQEDLGAFAGYVDEALSVHMASKAFGRETQAIAAFDAHNGRLHRSAYWAQTYSGFGSKLMYICDNLSFSLVLAVGGTMAIHQLVTIGIVITFSEYARQFSRQLTQVSMQIATILASIAGASRAFEILAEAEEADGDIELADLQGDIRFEDVGFAYDDGPPVLCDIDLHIPAGSTLALVGPTGAGKSTVVQLLSRSHDVDTGRILIDGVDLRSLRRSALRRQMGFVLQEPLLFDATVRENVRYAKAQASDLAVEEACRTANAHAFIEKLPHGYDTLLRHEGGDISDGQRQLLTIARAILADPKILILDEATSSVDTLTEAKIQEGLARLMQGRTCLIIAHRMRTVRQADEIIVLDRGQISERGSHEELLAAGGLYSQFCRGQDM